MWAVAATDLDLSTVLLSLATAGGFLASLVLYFSTRNKNAADTEKAKADKELALANTNVALDNLESQRINRLVSEVTDLRGRVDTLNQKHDALNEKHDSTHAQLEEAKEEINLLRSTLRRMRKHGVAVTEWYASYHHRFPKDVPEMPRYEDTYGIGEID